MEINKVANDGRNFAHPRYAAGSERPVKDQGEKDAAEQKPTLSREDMLAAVESLNSVSRSVNTRVSFHFNDDANRVVMKVRDGKTEEVIQEIPPRELIRLLTQIRETIGMFVDESR
ncbi:MAG TPA: flagellar protein FlaG [Spirochaetota bacterium]|nr:flagellar protein FlaG [Spirochaetota bacterium]HNT12565.1 flagellar protein FlaG [Spirochaetota bacterium]HNV48893.1 flagellar protein FlaG [Spirochaetota bacterium]HOS41134.1 flagellar protein FlaG [Spirochaetota bacterium]HPU90041.1 flagellar protein FlaG [Spirochaetota bacterium]